jgi:hypothetical protein
MTEDVLPPGSNFTVRWEGVDALPVQFVNSMSVSVGPNAGDSGVPDGIYLTFGVVAPPMVTATTAEEYVAALAEIPYVPIRPVGRFVLSREHAINLANFLASQVAGYDHMTGRGSAPTD